MEMSDELKKEVERLKKEETSPSRDIFNPKVIVSKNKNKETKKEFKQYKMNLPKEYMDIISKKEIQTDGYYDSVTNKLVIKIW